MSFFLKPQPIQALAVFILSLLIITTQLFFIEKETPYADNITYMSVALPLYEAGVFEDGNFKNSILPPGEKGEGMFFAPLYPAFLSGLMYFSNAFQETARCTVEHRKPVIIEEKCGLDLRVVWVVQTILGAISTVFIWLTAMILFKRASLAWLASFLVVTLGTFAYYASIVMAEALIIPLFYASAYCLILTWQKQKLKWALLAGLTFGALCLTKPSFVYLIYFFVPFITLGGLYQLFKNKNSKALQLLILSVVGTALIIGPWVYRNHVKLDRTAITYGYGPFTLSQRVAYNDMTAQEWFVSWIYGIPGEGDSIAENLFPKETYERWSWGDPKGFYVQGNSIIRAETLEAAGGHEEHLSYLLKNYVIADLPTHIATTFPLVYRGMWVFGFWFIIPFIAFAFLMFHCLKTKKYDYILYALPPWFMLGLHGFSTVNIPRYNIILQSCLGIALAWGLLILWERYKMRKKEKAA